MDLTNTSHRDGRYKIFDKEGNTQMTHSDGSTSPVPAIIPPLVAEVPNGKYTMAMWGHFCTDHSNRLPKIGSNNLCYEHVI